jgi:allantoicase
LRLDIFPDGGVARLRIYGEIRADFSKLTGVIDLFALEHGGRALACSDEHYGSMHNLNVAGRGTNRGDGWETARPMKGSCKPTKWRKPSCSWRGTKFC